MAEKDGFIYSDHNEHRAGRDGNGGIVWEARDKVAQRWLPAHYSQIPHKLRERAKREFTKEPIAAK